MGSEETTDGHVSKFIALFAIAGRNVGRRTGLRFAESGCVWNSSRMTGGLRGFWLSDQSGQKISIELESLILAQNERWRQA